MTSPRAIHEKDKLLKRELILDAAQQLWISNAACLGKMDELAKQSGVAKGTLYLYFRSKDEVLLALHERDLAQFFNRLFERTAQPGTFSVEELVDIFIDSIQSSPTFMPLSSYCHGILEQQIPAEQALQFKTQISRQIDQAVKALNSHLPNIDHLLMIQAYALTLGLWQLLQPSPLQDMQKAQGLFIYQQPELAELDFPQILHQSLLTLFHNQRGAKETAS
jgi:AcrR family transcriptional regulator